MTPQSGDAAAWPDPASLAPAGVVDAPHPSVIPLDDLLAVCRISQHRRGGPGGQHRNKVSSGIIVLHVPTGISAEANERRDQSDNRRVAIDRLRSRIAMNVRTSSASKLKKDKQSQTIRERWTGRPMKINASNFDHHAVLALVLDDLHRAGGQPSLVAPIWKTSTTSIVNFVGSQPASFTIVNRWREFHGRLPLRS